MAHLDGLNICLVAGTLGQGGAERQLFYMLRALMERGSRPRLLCLTEGEFWESRIHELGVPITWVGQSRAKHLRLLRIMAEVKRERPHVLQSAHSFTNPYVALAARALRIPGIGALRNDVYTEFKDNGRFMGRLILKTPRMIAANSRTAIRNAIQFGVPKERLQFLPNVVDTDHFYPPAQRGGEPVQLLAIGRLVEMKRFDRFLRILARLRNDGKNVRGILVGDGPLKSALHERARELGLSPDILDFRGALQDPAAVFREAHVLVLTSDHEGTPNVVLEAMASGLPVVATSVGGIPDIVGHGETGFLADRQDETALADLVDQLVAQPLLRETMGTRARDFVVANHSRHSLPGYLEGIYTSVLAS